MLLQIHIILCTGNIFFQLFSILASLVSLTVAACRSFYMKRDETRADAEPTPHMIIRWVFSAMQNILTVFNRVIPYMLMVLVHNISCWTFIVGILKGWTFLVLLFILGH